MNLELSTVQLGAVSLTINSVVRRSYPTDAR